MPSRRKAFQLFGSAVALGSSAGCLGVLQSGGIRIRIDNRDSQQHSVSVTFEDEDESVFNERYSVSAGEETTTSDVVEAGEYVVTVELDSAETKTVDFNMRGCDSNSLFVAIHDGGQLEAGVLDEC